MRGKSPHFIKIVVTPNSIEQMFRFIWFVRDKNIEAKKSGGARTIGICMGEMGKLSRILAKKFEMPYTYSTFTHERIIAPGMPVYTELRDLYHYEKTDRDTAVFGIIGNPIGHSLSPLIHNKSFENQGINAVYVPITLENECVREFMQSAAAFGIRGISVTIPHKVAVMCDLTQIDPAVEKIGACNTVLFRKNDQLGYNTDYMAAVSSIEIAMGGVVSEGASVLDGKEALVLGAGGAGKALAFGLQKRGAIVTVTDADGNRAYELSKHLDCEVSDWNGRERFKPDILANCTPIGMHPKVDEAPIDRSFIKPGMVVFDAVYNPEQTLLIKYAKQKGAIPVTGIEMFVGQACLQYKLFTGQKASASFIRKLVRDAIAAAHS